jgi:cytochrome c biogenesis factor
MAELEIKVFMESISSWAKENFQLICLLVSIIVVIVGIIIVIVEMKKKKKKGAIRNE